MPVPPCMAAHGRCREECKHGQEQHGARKSSAAAAEGGIGGNEARAAAAAAATSVAAATKTDAAAAAAAADAELRMAALVFHKHFKGIPSNEQLQEVFAPLSPGAAAAAGWMQSERRVPRLPVSWGGRSRPQAAAVPCNEHTEQQVTDPDPEDVATRGTEERAAAADREAGQPRKEGLPPPRQAGNSAAAHVRVHGQAAAAGSGVPAAARQAVALKSERHGCTYRLTDVDRRAILEAPQLSSLPAELRNRVRCGLNCICARSAFRVRCVPCMHVPACVAWCLQRSSGIRPVPIKAAASCGRPGQLLWPRGRDRCWRAAWGS